MNNTYLTNAIIFEFEDSEDLLDITYSSEEGFVVDESFDPSSVITNLFRTISVNRMMGRYNKYNHQDYEKMLDTIDFLGAIDTKTVTVPQASAILEACGKYII